jgi:hypothetical protein
MPIKVVGTAACVNQMGQIELWHFESDNVANWEALGMLGENLAIRHDMVGVNYFEWSDADDEE